MTSRRSPTTHKTTKRATPAREHAAAVTKKTAAHKTSVARGKTGATARTLERDVLDRSAVPNAREHLPHTEASGPTAERAMVDLVSHRVRTFFLRALCFSSIAAIAVFAVL